MRSILAFALISLLSPSYFAFGPFPIIGEIKNNQEKIIGYANVYPKYVEIQDKKKKVLLKVGVLVEEGVAKLFSVGNEEFQIVGHSSKGRVYNRKDEFKGYFVATPTYSFLYDEKGNRLGQVKCIAWPRVCAAGVAVYLLDLK